MTIITHPSASAGMLRGTVRRSLAHRPASIQDAAADIAVDLHADGHSGHRALTQALEWADCCYSVSFERGTPGSVARLRRRVPAHRFTGDDGPSAA